MTCIVGFVDSEQKRVVIGGDSAAVAGSSINIRRDTKVFLNKDFVIGCTSSFRMIQLLKFSFTPPCFQSEDIYKYMCTEFINAVRACFKEGGYLQKYTDGDEKGGTFLVGYKDRLFNVADDFQVAENLNGLDSIGCGADFALGSLYANLDQKISPESKVIKALEAAEFFSTGVCRPFIICSTNDPSGDITETE